MVTSPKKIGTQNICKPIGACGWPLRVVEDSTAYRYKYTSLHGPEASNFLTRTEKRSKLNARLAVESLPYLGKSTAATGEHQTSSFPAARLAIQPVRRIRSLA